MKKPVYDLAIVGYGPAGEALAATVGAAGLKVIVIERWPTPYPLPRLTTLDGEVCRVVQATSVNIESAFEATLVQPSCAFVDADGEPVLTVRFPGKLGGWPSRVSMFQPDFEKAVADNVATLPNVEILRGWEALELWQDAEQVHLSIAPFNPEDGSRAARTIQARYLVGADGARSFVRGMIGSAIQDFELHERWLNFDAKHLRPLPEHFMKLKIFMDPERPHMYMPIGKRGLRMEFRVMEHEADEDVVKPEVVWPFMKEKYGLGPEDVSLMRQVVYHYRSRIAAQWRKGRIFLAGDAAHTMAPYMGQGACSAIRDGRNLGWKLNEVLSGRSDAALLDDYQAEREPQVTELVLGSDKLARIVNLTDPAAAEQRNQGMRAAGDPPPAVATALKHGAFHKNADGSLVTPAGQFSPQGVLRRGSAEALGDNVLGNGFQLWLRQDPGLVLGEPERDWLDSLSCAYGVFEQDDSSFAVEDVEGVYRAFMNEHQVDAVLVRPDFYVFGAVRASQANALVHELAERLRSTARVNGEASQGVLS